MLPLPITGVALANVRVREKMVNVMLNLKTWKPRLKLCLNFRALNIPTRNIVWRLKWQRHEPLQLARKKTRCCFVGG